MNRTLDINQPEVPVTFHVYTTTQYTPLYTLLHLHHTVFSFIDDLSLQVPSHALLKHPIVTTLILDFRA